MEKKDLIGTLFAFLFFGMFFVHYFYLILSSYFGDYIAIPLGFFSGYLLWAIVLYVLLELVKRKKIIEKEVDNYFEKK